MFGRDKNAVDVETAQRLAADDGYMILDVRTDRERRQGHPPGSVHMLLETIPQRLDELRGKKVLAFCRSGNRSGAAAKFLNQHDIEAHNVRGGILAWSHAGLPLTTGVDSGNILPNPTPDVPEGELASATDDLLRPNHQGSDSGRPDHD